MEESMEMQCSRCGGPMDVGYATALGLIGGNPPQGSPKLVFVRPGDSTSPNPFSAFKQGLSGTRAPEAYLLRGFRCSTCGAVELFATESTPWP